MLTKPGGRCRSIFGSVYFFAITEEASAPAARLRQHDKKQPFLRFSQTVTTINQEYISTATEQDIPVLVSLVNSAYRGDSSRKGWTTEADLLEGIRTSEESLRELFQNPNALILKYENTGQLLGCVYLETKENDLYLGMLTVSPDAQTNGIGKQLLAAAEQLAIDRKCRAVTMTVITARHELIAWYERRGYQPTGSKQPFPDDPRFGIKKQTLEFMVMEKIL